MRTLLYSIAIRVYGLFRPNTTGVKGIVVDPAGRVLLVRHTYVAGWYLPGGGVKKGETPLDAVRRELLEEVGVDALVEPTLLGSYRDRISGRTDSMAVFVVVDWRQSVHANLEIAAARFFSPAELPAGATPATRARVREWSQGRPISPVW